MSLSAEVGACIALVGASGSGKSTVFHLIEHSTKRSPGTYCSMDDVRYMDHVELHNAVALVGQEPVLMSGTVEENILYRLRQSGNSNDRPRGGRRQVEAAARDANALTSYALWKTATRPWSASVAQLSGARSSGSQ